MKYRTTNELEHFDFEEAVVSRIEAANGRVKIVLDNVTILPENSCNRDIRKMRTHDFCLTLQEGKVSRLVEEGYKVYDADGNLTQTFEDRDLPEEQVAQGLEELAGLPVYRIAKEGTLYSMIVDGEDHSFRLEVEAEQDFGEWDRFLSMDSM